MAAIENSIIISKLNEQIETWFKEFFHVLLHYLSISDEKKISEVAILVFKMAANKN